MAEPKRSISGLGGIIMGPLRWLTSWPDLMLEAARLSSLTVSRFETTLSTLSHLFTAAEHAKGPGILRGPFQDEWTPKAASVWQDHDSQLLAVLLFAELRLRACCTAKRKAGFPPRPTRPERLALPNCHRTSNVCDGQRSAIWPVGQCWYERLAMRVCGVRPMTLPDVVIVAW